MQWGSTIFGPDKPPKSGLGIAFSSALASPRARTFDAYLRKAVAIREDTKHGKTDVAKRAPHSYKRGHEESV
jgi:hypothetical protein